MHCHVPNCDIFNASEGASALAVKALVGLLLAIPAAGCGGVEMKEGLVTAYGTVTLDGEPAPNVEVRFKHPQNPETIGLTDSNGYYEMAFTFSQEGAFSGENKVSFSMGDPIPGEESTITIPKQYELGRSTLTVEIKEDGSPYDFDLVSSAQPPK